MENKKREIAKYIIKNIVIFFIIYLAYLFKIRLCIIYCILKKPCPGCGLTRAFIELINGNIIESFKYNILLIPLIIYYIVYSFLHLKKILYNKEQLINNQVLLKHKKHIIIFVVIIVIVVEIINLKNPRLYK